MNALTTEASAAPYACEQAYTCLPNRAAASELWSKVVYG